MKRIRNVLVIGLIVALLMTSIGIMGCKDDEGKETVTPTSEPTATYTQEPMKDVTITIGNLTDLTGPAANALATSDAALEDLVDYYNEQNLIPGIKVDVLRYDTATDPSRFIPAYEWLKEKDVDFMYTQLSAAADVLQQEIIKDNILMFTGASTEDMLNPDGWMFSVSQDPIHDVWAMMKWVAENDWDYAANGPAKIGMAAWEAPDTVEYGEAMKQYADAHPEQYEYVGDYLTSVGSMLWSAEAEALGDCDYVVPPRVGGALIPFVKEYRTAGYEAKFVGSNQHAAWLRLYSDARMWDELDGMIITMPTPYWDQEIDTVELAREILIERYGPDKVETMMKEGVSYIGQIHSIYGLLNFVANAVEHSGAQNLNSQTLYDAAIQTSFSVAGNEWTWSTTDRTSWDYAMIYKFNAAKEDVVMADPNWYLLPLTP